MFESLMTPINSHNRPKGLRPGALDCDGRKNLPLDAQRKPTATEKLSDGIRVFAADSRKLEKAISAKLG
jgi:hypothetical protein